MQRKLLLVCFMLAALVGCKKSNSDGGDSPSPQEKGCKVATETINGKPYRIFEYDQNMRLFSITQYVTSASNQTEKRFTFEYESDGTVKVIRETNLLPPYGNLQYSLSYSGVGRLDTVRKYQVLNSGPKILETYALEYNDKGFITKYKWQENSLRYEYDDNGNLTKWFVHIPQISPEVLAAEYGNFDGKYNVYADTRPAELVNLVTSQGVSKQNPGSFKFYEASLRPVQNGLVNYEYNESDFPTKASISLFSPDGSPAGTQVHAFTYNCQ
ncbi:hypothetical protein [Persicitalea jodogahamensis]|uniref:DUF4595 domain-containing protein n=1 Tax=Persicitalea jodogahamensis TaxID=402147 RepID=A0A8J3GA66_9BACT|nr:hypothetical protein [Persicitalea jodogahamensis]GHB71907.1 hypothetical protein GCM10007390_27320 [Persicitalea jodogahamensis]